MIHKNLKVLYSIGYSHLINITEFNSVNLTLMLTMSLLQRTPLPVIEVSIPFDLLSELQLHNILSIKKTWSFVYYLKLWFDLQPYTLHSLLSRISYPISYLVGVIHLSYLFLIKASFLFSWISNRLSLASFSSNFIEKSNQMIPLQTILYHRGQFVVIDTWYINLSDS